MSQRKLRIFISSPGDVGLERELCTHVIERLEGKFGSHFDLEVVRWEERPIRASETFQPQIVPPSQTDIVVCILWSRLGTPLPADIRRPDGSRFASGTEWEFEDALRGYREHGLPDLLVFRRNSEPVVGLGDRAKIAERQEQYERLELFVKKWFRNEDGTYKAGYKTYESPDVLERLLMADLSHLLLERLARQGESEADLRPVVRWTQPPFRGLNAFEAGQSEVFCGRTRAISDIREALIRQAARHCPFLLIFGMSGCGKSSLVRAGVLARITRPGVIEDAGEWRICQLRPSDADAGLCQGLAAAMLAPEALPELAEAGVDPAALGAMLVDAPQHAVMPISMALSRAAQKAPPGRGTEGRPPHLIVFVDQLEEIFTLEGISDGQRRSFLRALDALARSGVVWVIAAMRSDFYHRCAEIPELAALKQGEGQYDLAPPSFDELGQMITEPALAAGLTFERDEATGERLDAVLHAAAVAVPESLPLLSFTLDELWRQRTAAGKLTFAAYRALGGLEGAIWKRAEAVYLAQSDAVRATLRPLIRGLAAVDRAAENVVAARRAPQARLATTPEHRRMLAALIDARLVVGDRTESGEPVARVAHEALLIHWPRVAEWLRDDLEFLQVRGRVGDAAAQWRADDRRHDRLLPAGRPLAEGQALLAEFPDELDDDLVTYIRASTDHYERLKRRRLLAAAGIAAAITAAGLLAYKEYDDGRKSIERARLTQEAADARDEAADQREQAAQTAELAAKEREGAAAREFEANVENRRLSEQLKAQAEHDALQQEFDRRYSNAGIILLDAQGDRRQALGLLERCLEIATRFAAVDGAEKIRWIKGRLDVLDKLAATRFALGDLAAGKELLERRTNYLASLPEQTRAEVDVAGAPKIQLTEMQKNFVRMQIETLIANEHLLALYKQNDLLYEALEARGGASDPETRAKMDALRRQTENGRAAVLEAGLRALSFAEFAAQTGGNREDLELLAFVYSRIHGMLVDFKRFDDVERLHERRVDFGSRMLTILKEKLAANSPDRRTAATPSNSAGSAARFAPAAQAQEDVRRQGMGLVAAHEQLGDARAANGKIDDALASYAKAFETLRTIPETIQSQDERQAQEARLHENLSKLWFARHEPERARDELQKSIALASELKARAVVQARVADMTERTRAARALAKVDNFAAARAAFAEALTIEGQLADETRSPVERRRLAELHADFGAFLFDLAGQINPRSPAETREQSDARDAYAQALELAEKNLASAADGENLDSLIALRRRYARFLERILDPAASVEQIRQALATVRRQSATRGDRSLNTTQFELLHDLSQRAQKSQDGAQSQALAAQIDEFLTAWRREMLAAAPDGDVVAEARSLAETLETAGLKPQAVQAQRALAQVREAAALAGGDPQALGELALEYYQTAIACARLGDLTASDQMLVRSRDWAEKQPPMISLQVEILARSAIVARLLAARDAALDFCRRALAVPLPIPERLPPQQLGLACTALGNVGRELAQLGEPALARDALARGLTYAQEALRQKKSSANVRTLMTAWAMLADLEFAQKDFAAAEAAYLAATDAAVGAPADDGKPERDQALAVAFENLGASRSNGGRIPQAVAAYAQAVALRRELQKAQDSPARRLGLSRSLRHLASAQDEAGDTAAAVVQGSEAAALLEPMVAAGGAGLRGELVGLLNSLAWWHLLLGQFDDAVARGSKAYVLDANDLLVAGNLANAYVFTGRWPLAEPILQKFKTARTSDGRKFADIVLDDVKTLANRGLTHPDFEKVKALLAEP